jgi:ankyrin repeat protein
MTTAARLRSCGAIGSGHPDCVWLLLDSGADANARDAEGSSALALARRKNRANLLEILLAAGASD